MQLTVDNFKLALGVISGRFNVGTLTPEQLAELGWTDAELPSQNKLKDMAENYVTTALIDISSRLYALEALDVSNRLFVLENPSG